MKTIEEKHTELKQTKFLLLFVIIYTAIASYGVLRSPIEAEIVSADVRGIYQFNLTQCSIKNPAAYLAYLECIVE